MMSTFSLAPIATQLEQTLRQHRLFELPVSWSSELVFPFYRGLSLRNIPHTVAELLGVPLPHSTPLLPEVWGGNAPHGQVDRVIALLMDGMGYLHLQNLCDHDAELQEILSELTDGRGFIPLTSVVPSTTCVALTTLWTGGTPSETGMFGTTMLLREYSTLANMLAFSPMVGKHASETLLAWGMKAPEFVPIPSLAEHLARYDIETTVVIDDKLMGTGLSRILHRGMGQAQRHISYSDWHLQLRDVLIKTAGHHCYVSAYWSAVDSIAHAYGAHTPHTHREIKYQLRELRDLLRDERTHDGRTLLLLIADHGELDAPNIINVATDEHTAILRDAMSLGLSGDNRLPILHLRDGQRPAVKANLDRHYADQVAYLDSDEAIAHGLYGSGLIAPQVRGRLGEMILIPRAGWRVQDPSVSMFPLISWHGGLDPWEMLIPLVPIRF